MTLATLNLDPVSSSSQKRCRVAMYSDDTMGTGHFHRNLFVAQALSRSNPNTEILLIFGSRQDAAFEFPPGTDTLTLPAIYKNFNGRYQSRNLPVSLPELVRLRSSTICAALEAFKPDLLIVDNVPRGMNQELDATLKTLQTRGETRCVLGLHDVLDGSALIQDQWCKAANEQAVADYYDAVWVYADSATNAPFDLKSLIAKFFAKVRYVGDFFRGGQSAGSTHDGGDSNAPNRLSVLVRELLDLSTVSYPHLAPSGSQY